MIRAYTKEKMLRKIHLIELSIYQNKEPMPVSFPSDRLASIKEYADEIEKIANGQSLDVLAQKLRDKYYEAYEEGLLSDQEYDNLIKKLENRMKYAGDYKSKKGIYPNWTFDMLNEITLRGGLIL